MKKIITAAIFAIISLSAADVYSKAVKRDYNIILALGWDQSFANQGQKAFTYEIASPIIFLDLIYYFGDTGWYGELGGTTTSIYTQWGYNTDLLHVGIKPIWNHSVVAADHFYYMGYENPNRVIGGLFSGGSSLGVELFYEFNFFKSYLEGRLMYKPGNHWYNEKNPDVREVYAQYQDYPPSPHWEHTIEYWLQSSGDFSGGRLEDRELSIIRHGWLVKFKHNYTNRTSYSLPLTADTSIAMDPNTHKFFLNLGLFYNFKGDFNLKFEAKGHYAVNVDTNNAEKAGNLVADNADMPGLYYAEFYTDKFIMANIKFGIPLPFWGFRLQPGFNMLYIPHDNKVISPTRQFADYFPATANGFVTYPYLQEVTYSVSLNIYFKIANILPVLIDYAYAFNAVRNNYTYTANGPYNASLPVQYGSHEVRIVFIGAFIETKPKEGTLIREDTTEKKAEEKIK